MADLLDELANEGVLAGDEFVERTIEDQTSFGEHQERGVGIGLTLGQRNHAVFRGLEAMSAHRECILQPMGDEHGWGVVDIALLHDELDDGGGGDGVEAAGRRIVEQQIEDCG